MPKRNKREPESRKTKFFRILAVLIAAAVLLVIAAGCSDTSDDPDAGEEVCEHDFVPKDSASNRQPGYGVEGRQYMVCTKCGFSILQTIPALELRPAEEAPDYIPLLDEYALPDAVSYDEFAEKYLPSAWSFKERSDAGTDGDVPDGGGELLTAGSYVMVFGSAYEGYESVETTIKIVVG